MSLLRDLHLLLPREGYAPDEREGLVHLVALLAGLGSPPDPCGLLTNYASLHDQLDEALGGSDGDAIEEAFLNLYAHLHGHEAPYTPEERGRVNATGGYWCHAGGLSPVLKAPRHLHAASTSADLGAGNGLQLLLLQRLAPHARSVQIEISSCMIEAGRALQGWLDIPQARVEWRCADLGTAKIPDADLLYLYRPLRPEGSGAVFYQRLAAAVEARTEATVIFSIADPLHAFLPRRFERFYSDGHLTCYRS
ncbi:MAG: hypothetical protein ABIJ09_22380 [Pseudomonadota bacterium]